MIEYLCDYCCGMVGISSNHLAENKAGRKICVGCGWNNEDWMHMDSSEVIDRLMDKVNKRVTDE